MKVNMNFGKFTDNTKQLIRKFEKFNKKLIYRTCPYYLQDLFERILVAEIHLI